MKTLRALTTLATIASVLLAPAAHAAIPRLSTTLRSAIKNREIKLHDLSCRDDFSKGMDASIIEPMYSLNGTSSKDIALIIPSNLVPSGDGGRVASQIIDHSLSSFFNSPGFRTSDIGRSATRVEKSMETGVEFSGAQPDSLKHELKFAMQPTQTRAVINYTGVTNAELSYQATAATVRFEVHEDVRALASQVVYNHTFKPGDATDTVSLRWVW